MKTAEDYLRERGLLKDGFTKFVVSFEDGEQFDVVELMKEYASQPKWISVEDCIPPLNQKVLGATDNGYIDLGYWNEEVGDIESCTSFFMHASYWQPLPTPPSE